MIIVADHATFKEAKLVKRAVSLCFVKSACVSDPDLPLLTVKHRKSPFLTSG